MCSVLNDVGGNQFAEYGRTRRDLARAEAYFFAPFCFNFLDISRACTCHTLQTGVEIYRLLQKNQAYRDFVNQGKTQEQRVRLGNLKTLNPSVWTPTTDRVHGLPPQTTTPKILRIR